MRRDKTRQLGPLGRRSSWSARLLGLECTQGSGDEPGVLLFQVDGLSHRQFLAALERGRLPFLRKLLDRGHIAYRLYSGVPSTTPAVQGELFYGVPQAVPAFGYLSREDGTERVMYDTVSVDRVAKVLEDRGEGLLKGGTAYSQIYTGGAAEARYCIQTLNLLSFLQKSRLSRASLVVLLHLGHLLRVAGLSLVELGLAVLDCGRGLMRGRSLLKEFKFVFSRIGASIMLRELIRFRAKLDTVRGVPIVSANFVGYDEHSHRRGPGSGFAHWTLKGIDGVIRDIHQTALRSGCRDYRLIVYSDHGQESAEPYEMRYGRTLEEAVALAFADGPLAEIPVYHGDARPPYETLYQRSRSLLWRNPGAKSPPAPEATAAIHVVALGPLGHVYLPKRLEDAGLARCARDLVDRAHVPLVIYRRDTGAVAVTSRGEHSLPERAEEVFGPEHPHRREVARDLVRLCGHPDAGDLVLSGWSRDGTPLTFVVENGAHGGPGPEETSAFAILPPQVGPADPKKTFSVSGLRQAVLSCLGRGVC